MWYKFIYLINGATETMDIYSDVDQESAETTFRYTMCFNYGCDGYKLLSVVTK